ncbi:MAG: hypothetical protein JWN65_893 [Solirubrobacterales bacterium]|nr:hypothetical protein [Solirubrobacterales bacterium]
MRSLRVAADRIDASIVSSIGRMKQVQVTWNGELRRFSESAPGFSRAGTFLIAALKRTAPFRLARSAAGRSAKAPSSIDYLVTVSFGPSSEHGWTVIMKNGGGQFLADAKGKITRRIS